MPPPNTKMKKENKKCPICKIRGGAERERYGVDYDQHTKLYAYKVKLWRHREKINGKWRTRDCYITVPETNYIGHVHLPQGERINGKYVRLDLNCPSLRPNGELREHMLLKLLASCKLFEEGYDIYIDRPIATELHRWMHRQILSILQPDVFGRRIPRESYIPQYDAETFAIVECKFRRTTIPWRAIRKRIKILPTRPIRLIEAKFRRDTQFRSSKRHGIEFWTFPKTILIKANDHKKSPTGA